MTHTENIAAALLLLKKMGIDPADLLQDPATTPDIPAFADYIPRVSQAPSPGTRRVYTAYWNRVTEAWGSRLITEPSPRSFCVLGSALAGSPANDLAGPDLRYG